MICSARRSVADEALLLAYYRLRCKKIYFVQVLYNHILVINVRTNLISFEQLFIHQTSGRNSKQKNSK